MSVKITATKFLAYTPEQLLERLEGQCEVVFADGSVQADHAQVIYSSFVWRYHKLYPKTPLLKRHMVTGLMKDGELGASAHMKLIAQAYWDVYDAYCNDVSDVRLLLDDLSRLAYEITNHMYNVLSVKLSPYVVSLDILDFLGIIYHPPIYKAQKEAEELAERLYGNGIDPNTKEAARGLANSKIEQVLSLIESEIRTSPALRSNPLAVAIRIGIARVGQALQCVGPRGFIQDVDSTIFVKPVMVGYVHGLRDLYSSMIESRAAAISLMNTTKPLQDSEYFSRRQQLVTMNVRNLHLGDCGSQNYVLWKVRDVQYEGVTKISDGDLSTIQGKYYLDEETNTLKVVRKSDTHLIGKTIKMRCVTAGCNHPDPAGACLTCVGETGLALPINSNLGHSSCVTMTAILGQLILSTKHYLASANVEGIVLSGKPIEKKFLSAEVNGNSYFLNEGLKNKRIKLYVNVDDAKGLPDLRLVSDVSQINLERTSQFSTVLISVDDGRGYEESTTLNVQVQHRLSSFSHEMLAYLKTHGFEVSKEARELRYEIDMSHWDYKNPIFVLPMRHFNMSDHQKEIADMLESTKAEMARRSKHVSPTNMLIAFHDLVNRRLNVNLAVLDVIIYSSMVVDTDVPNYDLPKPWTTSGMGVMRLLLANRSLSAMMGFQGHRNTFTDPSSFVVKNRQDHVFDVLFAPAEVMARIDREQPYVPPKRQLALTY